MRIGLVVPQGHELEFVGWEPAAAWRGTVAVAQQAEQLGFESVWLCDHFHSCPKPQDVVIFESFVALAAISQQTSRVRLGQLVTCASYRNPALATKMISTLDTVSGGRVEFGLGAGWNQDEFEAYGYGFPDLQTRLAILGDALEIAAGMLGPGHATYQGKYSRVCDAINVPKGLQKPRVPIIVGGNGRRVTWRLAARYADELNLQGMLPEHVRESLPLIADHCEAIGRDPKSLRVSVHLAGASLAGEGSTRRATLADYADLGVSRVICQFRANATDIPKAVKTLEQDARAVGIELAGSGPTPD